MFERWTERARQVVILAQDEARGFKHSYIGTEHILLGLIREEEGLAARVLDSLGVSAGEVRGLIARIVGQGDEVTTGQLPFTPRAKKMMEFALREALSLGHSYVGTEHILLGLVRDNEGVGVRILLDFDIDAQKIRNEIIRQLTPRSTPPSKTRLIHRGASSAHDVAVTALLGPGGPELVKEKALELLASEYNGLLKADAKHKKKIFRLERALVDHVDKNGRLKYELGRLEDALVRVYFDPDNAKHIVPAVIPKRIFKENQDPGKKKPRERPSRKKKS